MYGEMIASLLTFVSFGRERGTPRRPHIPAEFATLDDHTLRDIGFLRERPTGQRRHLLRF